MAVGQKQLLLRRLVIPAHQSRPPEIDDPGLHPDILIPRAVGFEEERPQRPGVVVPGLDRPGYRLRALVFGWTRAGRRGARQGQPSRQNQQQFPHAPSVAGAGERPGNSGPPSQKRRPAPDAPLSQWRSQRP